MQDSVASTGPRESTSGIRRQVVLPLRKSIEIAFNSIRVRFFRSLITTLSLVLAVSFLSFVSVSTDVANGLLASGEPEFRQALVRSGYDLGPEDRRADSSPKQRWIILLSLLVCAVGIVNAQLMAVTERFREIGTMKCLGALDRFVLRLFLLEAGMQGLVGAAAGALGGALFALLNGVFFFRPSGLRPGADRRVADVIVDGHRGGLPAKPDWCVLPGLGGRTHAAGGSHAGRTVALSRPGVRLPHARVNES